MLAVVLVFTVGALAGGWRPLSSEPDVYTYGPDADLAAFTLFDGQCGNGTLGVGAAYGPGSEAACGLPHDLEVVGAITPLNESREVTYPGEAALAAFGRAFCGMVFESGQVREVVDDVEKSDLRVAAIIPGEAAFTDPNSAASGASGGRLVSCVITRADGEPLPDRFSEV